MRMFGRFLRKTAPPRSRRRRWVFGTTVLVVAGAMAYFVVGAGADVAGSPSGFESGDGNMTLNATTASTNTDWNCFVGSAGFQSGTPNANCKVTSGASQTWADGGTSGVGTSEYQFKSGTKFDDPCVTINSGNNPPKDEWTNIAEYTEAASNNDLYFYGASIRPSTNGDSSGNVYFSQKSNGCHTPGDVLLAFEFVNGGGTPSLHALEWLASGSSKPCYLSSDSPPCWGNDQTINGTYFEGNVNTSAIAAGDNGISGTALAANAFAEFGINLTEAIKAAGGGSLPCFANQTWVSRSSGSSFSSNPEDVEVVNRPTCGTITIVKHTLNGAGTRSGINQQFSYGATGLTPSSFHLNDAGGAPGDVSCTNAQGVYADSTATNPCNSITYSNVPAGSYTVNEGAEPANFAFVSLTCNASGNGTSASQDTTTTTQADITLGISGSVVCTYVNQQQLGAIQITKTNSKSGAGLNGATFEITGPNSYDQTFTTSGTGSAAGKICVASLPFGSYSVTEKTAPTGYAIDNPNAQTATVNAFGDCSGNGTPVQISASDTPLTTLEVIATGEASPAGTTKSTIACTHQVSGSAATVGTSITTAVDPADWKTQHLKPDTYTCTIVIDP